MAKPGVSKHGVNEVSAAMKQRRALELRIAGHTFEEIASELGYTYPSGAKKAVDTALFKTLKEPAERLRDLEVARMDVMLKSLWPDVLAGKARSVEVAIKVLERRAKLLGLDAPLKFNVEQIITETAERHGLNADEQAELHESIASFLATQKAIA